MLPHCDGDRTPPLLAHAHGLVSVRPTMATGRRPALNAPVSDEAREGWLGFVDEHGLTYTALCEAIGLRLKEGAAVDLADPELLVEVRRVMAQRKGRGDRGTR